MVRQLTSESVVDSHRKETLKLLEAQGKHHVELVSSQVSVNPSIRLKRMGKQTLLFFK